jgi:hypothetical protein
MVINERTRVFDDGDYSIEEGLDELSRVFNCILNPIYVPLIINTKWATPIIEYLLNLDLGK